MGEHYSSEFGWYYDPHEDPDPFDDFFKYVFDEDMMEEYKKKYPNLSESEIEDKAFEDWREQQENEGDEYDPYE